jgi:hypothetical protein
MKNALKDPRTKTLMKELSRRFPGTTLVTRPMRDAPGSGEILLQVLNAPTDPPDCVERIARRLIWRLWGDGPHPVYVDGVSAERTAKYRADDLPTPRRARATPRRRPAVRRKRAAAR